MSKSSEELLQLVKFVPTKTIPIEKIVFDENNPNSMSQDQVLALEKVVEKYGFAVDPWVNQQPNGNYMVIDGEHRVRILQKKGVKEIQVKVFQVKYSDVRILRQVANKLRGEHDDEKDAFEFKAIFEEGNLDEFAMLLSQPLEDFEKILEKKFDISFQLEDDIPEPTENPTATLGDIYQLGKHRIMCGDSLSQLPLLLKGKEPHMLFTDPPYGLGGYAGRSGKFKPIKGDDEDTTKFYECLPKTIPERYIWGNWFNIKSIKETPRDIIIWKKNNFGMGRGYRGQYEICLYFGTFNGSDSDVWEVKKDTVTEYIHPTQKPLDLPRRAIINSTKNNDIVLDAFLGSGSTLIACEQTDRICYGMEIDPAYIDVIIQRWENLTGKKAQKL